MWQVAKEGPAFDAGIEQAEVRATGVARAPWKRVERAVATRAQAKAVAPKTRRGYAAGVAPGVAFVEAAVAFAVAAYFVAGVIGVFVK